jgi:hypothetical protein
MCGGGEDGPLVVLEYDQPICDVGRVVVADFGENTHHATFDSVVGIAIASLAASCFSLWTTQVGSETPRLAARDLALLRTASVVLEPLVEGMALFTEHDLVTGPSPAISAMSRNGFMLFTKGRFQGLAQVAARGLDLSLPESRDMLFSRAHTLLLETARKTPEWEQRKLLLLDQPLDGPHRYLLGYLAVKGMYRTLSTACSALRDPEVFILVLIRHFFHDEATARILLGPLPQFDSPVEAYIAIGNAVGEFLNRYQDLSDELYLHPRDVTMRAIEPLLKSAGQMPLIGSEETISPNSKLPSDLDFWASLRTLGTFNIAWPRLLKHRSDFRFSFQEVLFRVRSNGKIRITIPSEKRSFSLLANAVEHSAKGKFVGSIEALILRDFKVVICFLANDGLIAVLDCQSGEWNPPALVEHLDDLPSAVAVEGAMHAFKKWQDHIFEHKGIREMIEAYDQQAKEAVDLLYPQLIVHRRPMEERAQVITGIAKGVASLFEDPKMATQAAELSVLVGVGANLEAVVVGMGVTPDALRDLVNGINAIAGQRCGLELFLHEGDALYSII